MNFTDAEIMMIEQLTYYDVDTGDKGKTIGEILSGYTDKKLADLEKSNPEKAAIIRYLKSNENISKLVLASTMQDADGKTLALCFIEPGNENEAIVAFQGTTKKEWGDNFTGLNQSDTKRQIEALDYIESLPYDNITVTGHSKGGNKAMYVAITSDKVTRCVSMDGQGFSQEFIDKYAAEIEENANKIKNYSVKSDYVHILLFQPPGSEQVYCEGFRIDDITGHHQSSSFFKIDADGNIIVDENGMPIITDRDGTGNPITEDPSVIMLHDFTVFVLNIASPEDKEEIVNMIATLADMLMIDKCSPEEMAQYLLANKDALVLVLAYLIKYIDTYDLSTEDIDALLHMLGLDSLDDYLTVEVFGYKICGLSDLINLMLDNLTDGKNDPIINAILAAISGLLGLAGIDFDIKDFWKKTEGKINSIGDVRKGDGKKEPSIREGKVRDFSIAKYEVLMSTINKFSSLTFTGVDSWSSYASEDWYGSLMLNALKKAISAYYEKVAETNTVCKSRVEKVFSTVEQIDNCALLRNMSDNMERAAYIANFKQICSSIG